jgi:signal transduction histidine kinase
MAELQSIVAAAPAPVELDIDRSVVSTLNAQQASHVLRIAREGVSNVARHAAASRAQVSLRRTADAAVRLEIADDGVGLPAGAERSPGLGLHHIAARGRKLGGRARVESPPGGGTRIVVEFPASA